MIIKEFVRVLSVAISVAHAKHLTREECSVKRLFSASELAKMGLPGLPTSKGAIIARAESEGWRFEEQKGLGGTRRAYEVPARYFGQPEDQGAAPGARSAVLNDVAGQKIRRYLTKNDMTDSEIVESITLGVENWIKNNNLPENPEKKAALVALLFSYFRAEGGVTKEKLEEMLRKVA